MKAVRIAQPVAAICHHLVRLFVLMRKRVGSLGFQVATVPSFYRGHPLRPHRTSADVSWGLKQWLIRSHGQSDEKNECRRIVPVLKSRLKLTSHRGHPRITAPSNLRSPQMSAGV